MTTERGLRIGESALGAGIVALGLFIAADVRLSLEDTGRTAVGPALFPYLVAAGLVLIGGFLLAEALRGRIAHGGGFDLDGRAVALTSAGLVGQMLLLEFLGWIIAATLLFVLVAHAFRSPNRLLDVAFGLLLAAASFAVFTLGLDLELPGGIIAKLIMNRGG